MRSETEIKEMLEKLKAMYNEVPLKDKYMFSPILIQIKMLEYVLEIGTGDLCFIYLLNGFFNNYSNKRRY